MLGLSNINTNFELNVTDLFKIKRKQMRPYIFLSYPKYSDKEARASSADPDQTPLNAASDQGVHCLPLVQ